MLPLLAVFSLAFTMYHFTIVFTTLLPHLMPSVVDALEISCFTFAVNYDFSKIPNRKINKDPPQGKIVKKTVTMNTILSIISKGS